jgi:hypothetical protein
LANLTELLQLFRNNQRQRVD